MIRKLGQQIIVLISVTRCNYRLREPCVCRRGHISVEEKYRQLSYDLSRLAHNVQSVGKILSFAMFLMTAVICPFCVTETPTCG